MLSLLAFFAYTMGLPYLNAQIAERAIPLASAVRNKMYVIEIKIFLKFVCNASHKRAIDAVIEKPVDLYNVSGQVLPSLTIRSFSSCIASSKNIIKIKKNSGIPPAANDKKPRAASVSLRVVLPIVAAVALR